MTSFMEKPCIVSIPVDFNFTGRDSSVSIYKNGLKFTVGIDYQICSIGCNLTLKIVEAIHYSSLTPQNGIYRFTLDRDYRKYLNQNVSITFDFHMKLTKCNWEICYQTIQIPSKILQSMNYGNCYQQNIVTYYKNTMFNGYWVRKFDQYKGEVYEYNIVNDKKGVKINECEKDFVLTVSQKNISDDDDYKNNKNIRNEIQMDGYVDENRNILSKNQDQKEFSPITCFKLKFIFDLDIFQEDTPDSIIQLPQHISSIKSDLISGKFVSKVDDLMLNIQPTLNNNNVSMNSVPEKHSPSPMSVSEPISPKTPIKEILLPDNFHQLESKMENESTLNEVTFITKEGISIPCNMKKLFELFSPFKSISDDSKKDGGYKINTFFDAKTMKAFVQYSNGDEDSIFGNEIELYKVAADYSLDGLKEKCLASLTKRLLVQGLSSHFKFIIDEKYPAKSRFPRRY